MSSSPTLILKEGTTHVKKGIIQKNNMTAAIITAEMVRSTLGPRGLDKMLTAIRWTDDNLRKIERVTITNDGSTILKDADFKHPISKLLVEAAKAQDSEVGDGTTSVVVFIGELIKKAQKLIEKGVHPNVLVDGYKIAAEKAKEILDKIAIKVDKNNDEILKKIAITSMGSKSASIVKEYLADIAVKAIRLITKEENGKVKVDINNIEIVKKSGKGLEETEIIKGIIIKEDVIDTIEAGMPRRVKDARIALVKKHEGLDLDRGAVTFVRELQVDNPDQLQNYMKGEKDILKGWVDKIADAGVNVLFCKTALDYVVTHNMVRKGIMGVRRVDEEDLKKIAKATGARIASHIDDIGPDGLGEAALVEEVKIGGKKLIFLRDCKNPDFITILLRGGTKHVVDEAERALHDALCVIRNVVEDEKIVAGGGSPEAELSKQIRELANTVGGREQLAVEAFADSLESIPSALAQNAGLDPITLLVNLKANHKEGNLWHGVNVFSGKIEDMKENNILEPLRVKMQIIKSATETACMIIRIDELLCAKMIDTEKDEGLEARLREMKMRGRIGRHKRRWKQTPVWVPK